MIDLNKRSYLLESLIRNKLVAHEQADQAYEVLSGINEIQYKKFMSFLIDGKIKEAEDLLNQLTYTYANHEMS